MFQLEHNDDMFRLEHIVDPAPAPPPGPGIEAA
jgi:hypothetical protein